MVKALGTLLKIGDGGGTEVFTTIADVYDITGPDLKLDTAETTNHSSTGGWDEYIGTILRGGTVGFDIGYAPTEATHNATAGLINDMENRTLRHFQLVFPDAGSTTWSLSALVVGFQSKAPVNGELRATVSLKLSGQPTLA